jgi:hypothetical protein
MTAAVTERAEAAAARGNPWIGELVRVAVARVYRRKRENGMGWMGLGVSGLKSIERRNWAFVGP